MKRPCVQIKLHQPLGPKTIYTTGDTIAGNVLFTPDELTSVDDLVLDFQGKGPLRIRPEVSILLTQDLGSEQVSVENMLSHVCVPVNTIKRRLLRMNLPVYECIPDISLKPGTEYTIPFDFVVPKQLPVQVCQHQCSSIQQQQEHLSLPPSLGHTGLEESNDMTPEDVKVFYEVKLTVLKSHGGKRPQQKSGEYSCPVHVLPQSPELAPILIPPNSRYYQPVARKTLNKGILRSPIGRLTTSTAQPPAIKLSTASHTEKDIKSKLRINIAFEPAHADDLPPKFVCTQLKLKAMTFFGVEPWKEFPDQTHPVDWDSRVAYWSKKVPLSSDKMTVNWTRQPQAGATDGRTIYTTSVELIGSLPADHAYPPTFHSCFVSRVYALSAVLRFRSHEKAQRSSNLTVTAPVQIIP